MGSASDEQPALRRRPRIGALIAGLVLVALAGRAFVAEPFSIPSDSMAPTLVAGDHVLVSKLPEAGTTPARGDLVVFEAPGSGEIVLKRVVALSGEEVGIEDGRLVVDGKIRRESYADPDDIDGVYFGPVVVERGAFFVLGDNRLDSVDSREFGAVPESAVIGRVVARMWPPSRWGSP